MLRIEKSAWVLAIVSGVLQVAIFPLPNLYVLSWVAVAPLLVAILRARRPGPLQLEGSIKLLPASPMQGLFVGYLCGIVWYAGSCYWVYDTMKQYGGIGTFGAAGLLVLFCLYLGSYHGAFGLIVALIARRSIRTALVSAPFVWVALEFARTRISGFPWDLLGIAQADNVPLARIAQVTGVYGISLEIMVVNTAFAAAFLLRRNRRTSLLFASFAAAFALQIAGWMPVTALSTGRSAVLVQENVPVLDSSDWTRQYFEDTLRELSVLSQGSQESAHNPTPADNQLKWPTPGFIVWPESPAPFYGGDPEFRRGLSQLAIESHAWVVAGNVGVESTGSSFGTATKIFNSASLISPSGEWIGRYDKIHLVPFGEYVPFKQFLSFAGGLTKEVGDFTAGATRQPLRAGEQKLGVFICYESIFPDEVRQFAKSGAQVLVNISNDGWYGDSGAYAQHLKQARMRAIENDRWLLRSTNTGVTAAIDPFGRVTQTVPRKVRTSLVANYELVNQTTFYTRHGDWLAYACAIISFVALAVSLTPGKGKV